MSDRKSNAASVDSRKRLQSFPQSGQLWRWKDAIGAERTQLLCRVGAFKEKCERLVGLLQERLCDVEIAKVCAVLLSRVSASLLLCTVMLMGRLERSADFLSVNVPGFKQTIRIVGILVDCCAYVVCGASQRT